MAAKKKSGNIAEILIAILVLVILGAVICLSLLLGRMPENPTTASGNTGGNLNNGGLFCEYNGKIFFSNSYDGGALYSMNADGSEMKRLDANNCFSINAYGDYLYYVMQSGTGGSGLGYVRKTTGIFRSKQNGKDITSIDDGYAIILSLCGNYLYAQQQVGSGTGLVRHSIDNKKTETVADYVLNPSTSINGQILYNGTKEDHALYLLDGTTAASSLYLDGNFWNPVYDMDYIYYMDVSHNYRLCRISPTSEVTEVVTNDRVDFFNVLNGVVFYQKSSKKSPGLYRVNGDGSDNILVSEGIYEKINMTSGYTYFKETKLETPIYKVNNYGDPFVTTFEEAAQAALKNMK